MSQKFILRGHNVIPSDNLLAWADWLEHTDRRVASTIIQSGVGIVVSTVFLGLDYHILFETMCFGGVLDSEQVRYSTWKQAVKGHEEMVSRVYNTIIAKE